MKKILFFAFLFSFSIFAYICACSIAAQNKTDNIPSRAEKPAIIEVKSAKHTNNETSEECLKTFRDFFEFIRQSSPDISTDPKAQIRWLSYEMRKAVLKKKDLEDTKAKENPTDKREYPDNGSFVGAWDYPTTYEIVGSRQYDDYTIIDVRYKWGEKTDYPGVESLRSFIFVKENDSWKLGDIYTFDERYNEAESLINYFRKTY